MEINKNTLISGFLGLLIGAYGGTVSTVAMLKPYRQAMPVEAPFKEVQNKTGNEKVTEPSSADQRPPPNFESEVPDVIKTDLVGEVRILWTVVDQAKRYQINLYSEDGRKIKTWKTAKQSLYLTGIPYQEEIEFTPYTVTLQTMNSQDVPGPESVPRKLLARRLKSIVAPTIKSISTED